MCWWYRYVSQQHTHRHAYTCTQFAVARMCMAECLFKGRAGMPHNVIYCMSYFIMLIMHRGPQKWYQTQVSMCLPAGFMMFVHERELWWMNGCIYDSTTNFVVLSPQLFNNTAIDLKNNISCSKAIVFWPVSAMCLVTAAKWTLECEPFCLCVIRSDVKYINSHLTVGGVPGAVFLCVGALTRSLSS